MTMNELIQQTRAVAADIYRMEADALREEARAIAEAAYATGIPKLESISDSPSIYYGDPVSANCDDALQAQAWVPTKKFMEEHPTYTNQLHKPDIDDSQDDWNATGIDLMAPRHVCPVRFNELRQQLHDAKGTPRHAELAQEYYSLLALRWTPEEKK